MSHPQKKSVFFNMQDVVIDTIDHKVKIFHKPTKTIVESNQHKSLHKNKVDALLKLQKSIIDKSIS